MDTTLTQLDLVGVGNAGLLLVAVCPAGRPIVEDINETLMPPELAGAYLQVLDALEYNGQPFAASVQHFNNHLDNTAACVKTRAEYEYFLSVKNRLFRLWKSLVDGSSATSEQEAEQNSKKHIATIIAGQMTERWAMDNKVMLPMANVYELVETLIEKLDNGTYFSEEIWDNQLTLGPDGQMKLTNLKLEQEEPVDDEDDFSDFFDNSTIVH